MTSSLKTAKNHQCLLPPAGKSSAYQLPQTFPSKGATSKASAKPPPDAQESLADKMERLIKRRSPSTLTSSRRACRETQPNMNTLCRAQRMTEYKENFGFLKNVHSPPAPKKSAPHLPINLLDHPEARFADKYRRTEYQTSYGCKLRAAKFSITLFRQIHGTG